MVRKKIKKLINFSLKLFLEKKRKKLKKIPEIQVSVCAERKYGDYMSNVAFVLAKVLKIPPLKLAQKINEILSEISQKEKIFEKIEVVSPGFINFFLSKIALQNYLWQILKKKKGFLKIDFGKGKRVQVEFISANPTGPLHIGNGRGAFFGDCLARVLERAGFKVEREYFINDGKFNSQIQSLGKTVLGKDKAYLTDYLQSKIKKLSFHLKKTTSEKEAGYLMAKEILKDIKEFVEKELKIRFDNWVSEQELFEKREIDKVYQFLKEKGLVYEKEGAKWLKISQFGAPKDEVIIRNTGEPSYFLSDIAYHKNKFDRSFDKIINIWGADHQGHVPKIKAIAKIFNYRGSLEILISQIVTLKGGKRLSKRKGEIITLKKLIENVGLDVARFFYLTKSLDSPMEFDMKLAKEKSQQNPLFYIQYAFARICSIFKKGKIKEKEIKVAKRELSFLVHPLEIELIKELIRFPEIIEDCCKDYQLQKIPNYALGLAKSFHNFYENCQILREKENLKKARLALVLATKMILKETLSLMGISAPKVM